MESFREKLDGFNELIYKKNEKISKIKREIYDLEDEIKNHLNSCKHIFDNGESALGDTSYWSGETYYHNCPYSGEELEESVGYTVYQKTCKLCDNEFNN